MKKKIEIKIFIASPGDTLEERNLIHSFIDEWNTMHGDDKDIYLKIVRWENDLAITSNVFVQDEIDLNLLENSDILTGMFWTRFGSPTNKSESGTLQEIKNFLSKGKPVMMYFLDKEIKPSIINTNNLDQIHEFKTEYAKHNIYRETDLKDKDQFRVLFTKDLNKNVNKLLSTNNEERVIQNGEPLPKSEEDRGKWYEQSIKQIIEQKLAEYDLPYLAYRREISFIENCNLWRSLADTKSQPIINTINKAREQAFSIKYGNYDYSKDLRNNYDGTWYLEIVNFIKKEGYDSNEKVKVIGVASNNGKELMQIFGNFKNSKNISIEVLDLSAEAVKNGKHSNTEIKFHQPGNMEECSLKTGEYDIYLNLRSIHSSGVDIRMTLAECFRIIKPGGIAIISVSNGYLTLNTQTANEYTETKGMYDNRVGSFSTKKPYDLANKIRSKLADYGFKETEIHTGQTEIIIKAIR